MADFDADIYQQLFDLNPRPMWVFERETRRFLMVNEAAVRQYGWSREEFLGMTLVDLRPPEERTTFEVAWAAPKEGATYGRVGRHWKKNGEVIEVDMQITSFEYRGRLVSLAMMTNITGIAEAERRFKLLVEHSAEGIVVNREDFSVEYMSAASERILGFSASELVDKRPGMQVHPDDVGKWQSPQPFETKTQVVRLLHRDGTWRWIESTTTNLLRDPAVHAYVTNYRDITARREVEVAMLETKRRLEYLLSATSAVTYTAAAGDFGTTFISANVEAVMGYRPEQFVSEPEFWFANVHPDDRAQLETGIGELFEHGAHTFDYRLRHSDGRWRSIRDAARLVRDKDGAPVEIVGYLIDITEQYEAQQSLTRSEMNFRALIERAPTAIYVQRDGTVIYANPAAVALFGYGTEDEMVALRLLDLVHPDDRDQVHGTMPASEGRMVRRDGSVFVAEVEAIQLEFDGVMANVVFARDVTERGEMLARMALADRMLTVGTLAAGVAHEINNPLSYVATNLEILAADLPCLIAGRPTRIPMNDLLALVGDASHGVERVSAIVRDLRELAKPEDEARGPVDVAAVLASSIKMANNEIRHRATVVESYAPGIPAILANGSRLGQVFLNLLLNAAHAIPEGHAEQNAIRVRARAEGDRVVVEVEDTGTGISPALTKRIFDPFFTTKAPGVGMGLGLSISHQIVRALGGEIEVESTVGAGTTFRVTLPVASRVDARPRDAAAAPSAGGARILIVDDEAAVGRSLCALLAGEHVVTPVTHARDALERIGAGEVYDVIVCDLMMPEVSGIELYAQFSPENRERVVFMTGGAFTPQARDFLAKTDRPRLEKPFTEHELRRVIEQVRGVGDR